MGQIAYRANLSAATFPMTIADGGRTVIIPGPDQNFDRRVDPQGEQKDAGIPQALYMENVVPTVNGYQSVGYITPSLPMTLGAGRKIVHKIEVLVGVASSLSSFTESVIYVDDLGNLTCGNDGRGVITYSGTGISGVVNLSTAVVATQSYLYNSVSGELYTITGTPAAILLTNVTASVTPATFLSASAIVAITGSNNYLVAAAPNRIYYSSLTTPTDFTSSLVSGAGSIVPNNLIGNIVYIENSPNGFYAFTYESIISAEYTGNARYPWKFNLVKNVAGIKDPGVGDNFFNYRYSVYSSPALMTAFVITENNFVYAIERDRAESASMEMSQFLSDNSIQELLNYLTNTFTPQTYYTLAPRVFVFDSRYLLVSINDSNSAAGVKGQYTHVIVFDYVTRRAGKLKVTHDFISQMKFEPGSLFAGLKGKVVVGFIDGTLGTIKYLNFDIYNSVNLIGATYQAAQGALLLGKFQYVRSRMMQLEEIEIEGPQNTAIVPSPNFSVALLPSTDGRNFDAPIPLTPRSISGGLATYDCHNTAKNHSLLIKGAFSVNTLQLKFVPGGER